MIKTPWKHFPYKHEDPHEPIQDQLEDFRNRLDSTQSSFNKLKKSNEDMTRRHRVMASNRNKTVTDLADIKKKLAIDLANSEEKLAETIAAGEKRIAKSETEFVNFKVKFDKVIQWLSP